MAQASYLIGCGTCREAIVLDPHRDVEQYLKAARDEGMRITAVSETHVHADFLSGSGELARQTGAQLYLSGEARGAWSYTDDFVRSAGATLLVNGSVIRLGAVRIEAIHTPGHTPEHLTFLVTDTAGAPEPMGAVTGDFVFVGDVGRPDLLERAVHVAGTADEAARQLFHSLSRLRGLADYLQLWPGHGAGSACGKGISAVPQSTLGYERRHNWALRVDDEAEFVAAVLEGQPEPPAYFADMKRLNARGSCAWPGRSRPPALSAEDLAAVRAGGAVVIDTRPRDEFAVGHIAGTINIPLDRSFLTWTGALVPLTSAVILVGDESEMPSAIADLALIGVDRVVGVVGPDATTRWRESGHPVEQVRETSVAALASRRSGHEGVVLDVRGSAEWAAGHVPGAVHIPLTELRGRLDDLTRGGRIVVYCQSGARSSIAASLLMAGGFASVENLVGGLTAWQDAGQRVVTGVA